MHAHLVFFKCSKFWTLVIINTIHNDVEIKEEKDGYILKVMKNSIYDV